MKNFIFKGLKNLFIVIAIILLGLFLLLAICNCDIPNYTLIDHYKNDANFINDTATITNISYSDQGGNIYICFSDLRREFQDIKFVIPVDVAEPELKIKIIGSIKVGDQVKFTSDPWFYGNGYSMPIVAIWSAEGEPLLEYEEGYANLMKWLKEK